MKANELQIGDLVQIDGKIGNVSFISELGDINVFIDETQMISTRNPNPIPITAELLENNFPEPTDGITWYPEEGGFNCHTYVPDCEINAFGLFKYVHQLQHALRLCGIEKEIII